MRTTKISIAIDKGQLRSARRAAKTEGLSLSGYIALALENRLEQQVRIDAARELHRSWGRHGAPTAEDRGDFLAKMSRSRKRRDRAA